METAYRNIAPEFKTIDHIEILSSKKYFLSNNIPVYIINGGSQDVVKIEFIFSAGIWDQDSPLIATMTNSMLNEGTNQYNSAEIAEQFDFFGAYIGFTTEKHEASITLYTLKKHLQATLQITENLIKNSIFPEKEFQTILNNKKQKFQIEHQKTNVRAKDKLNELIYGEKHPYANTYSIEEFDKLKLSDLKEFYKNYYTPNNCHIIVAGKVDEEVISLIENLFGENSWSSKNLPQIKKHIVQKSKVRKAFVCMDNAVQASIRIGREIFNKTHPDYVGIQLLNLILGGYFGSRLMQNIREDKGYTYGINSILISHLHSGHLAIVTEVGADVCKPAIDEIFKEIKVLREELVPEDELLLVKNYISGEMLRNLDSPFALSESLKGNLPYGFDNSYYQQFIKDLKEISAERIKELSNQYLKEEDLFLVVCGPEGCKENIFMNEAS